MHPAIHFVYCGVFKCRCKDASARTSALNQIHWGIWSADKNVNESKYVHYKKTRITKVTFHGKFFQVYDYVYENRCSFETVSLSVATVLVSMPDGQRLGRVQTEICILQN